MIWKPTAEPFAVADPPLVRRMLPDWVRAGGDGFGLPLVGALLGLPRSDEPELDATTEADFSDRQG